MVDPIGLEPTTSWMQIRRSTRWAKGPYKFNGGPGKTWTYDLTVINGAL
jgi:hypothetical protein